MKYLRVFESVSAYNTFADSEEYVEPNVSRINEGGLVKYNKARHDYSQDYLTFVFSTTGSIELNHDSIYLSNDNGNTWTQEPLEVNAGDRILAKGDMKKSYYDFCTSAFELNGTFSVEGNVMSIYDSIGFRTRTSFDSSSHDLGYLFYEETGLTSAENLVLPATALTYGCYAYMFQGCTSLTTAPKILPAMTLADNCYNEMFYDCTSLTTAPELPATTLASGCYYGMFQNCTSLTTAPELPVTTLAESCYSYMFQGCTSLTTAPELPATTLAPYCYYMMFYDCTTLNYIKCLATNISASDCTYNWVSNVASTGTFVKNPNMSSWTTGNSGIPSGWTVEDAS